MECVPDPTRESSSISYVSSARGNRILIYNDRQYSKSKEYKNGSVLWRCLKRSCKGYLTVTSNERIHKQTVHSCSPCGPEVEVRKALDECRHVAATTCTPIPTLYKNTISKLESKGLNLVTNLPSYKRLKSGLYQHRNRAHGVRQVGKRTKMKSHQQGATGKGAGDQMMGMNHQYPDCRPSTDIPKDSGPDHEAYKNEYEFVSGLQRNNSSECDNEEQDYGDTVAHELLKVQIKMKQESLAMKKEFYSTYLDEMRKQTSVLQDIARHLSIAGVRNNNQSDVCTSHYQQL